MLLVWSRRGGEVGVEAWAWGWGVGEAVMTGGRSVISSGHNRFFSVYSPVSVFTLTLTAVFAPLRRTANRK